MCRISVLSRFSRYGVKQVLVFRRNYISEMSGDLEKVNDVDIDAEGVFKYVLIHVKEKGTDQGKKVVRGFDRPWHGDIFDEFVDSLKKISPKLEANCLGGGRIHHDAKEKKLNVYGYSQGFGQAKHEESVALLKTKYPDYCITWSNDGY